MAASKDRKSQGLYERIYAVVRKIPSGQVATYGQIARCVEGCTPRIVGYAMAGVPEGSSTPWQRVVNIQGKISPRGSSEGAHLQRALLESEGVIFDHRNRIDLSQFAWDSWVEPTEL